MQQINMFKMSLYLVTTRTTECVINIYQIYILLLYTHYSLLTTLMSNKVGGVEMKCFQICISMYSL